MRGLFPPSDERNSARMHSFYICVPREILVVKCQNTLDTMHARRGHKTCIVNLHTRDTVRHQNPAPLFVNCKVVREQAELFLESPCESVRLLGRQAVAIAINRASTGVPKFADILRGVTEDAIMPKNRIRG